MTVYRTGHVRVSFELLNEFIRQFADIPRDAKIVRMDPYDSSRSNVVGLVYEAESSNEIKEGYYFKAITLAEYSERRGDADSQGN